MNQPFQPEQASQHTQQESLPLSKRIWKHRLHYVIPLPAWLLLFFVSLPPLFNAFLIPFKDFQMHLGISGSAWTGWESFHRLFGDPVFLRAMANTAIFKLGGALLGSLLALGLALGLRSLPWRRLRESLLALFLLPFFIPSAVIVHTIMELFSADSPFSQGRLVFGEPMLARLVLIAVIIVKTCGIPVALALAAIAASDSLSGHGYAKAVILPALRAVCAFALVQLSGLLTVDFDLIYAAANPLIFESVMTVDFYMFRSGFQMMDFSLAGAAWLVQFLLQLPLLLAAYFLIRRYLTASLFADGRAADPERPVGPAGWSTGDPGRAGTPHGPVFPERQSADDHGRPKSGPFSPLVGLAGAAAVTPYALVIGFLLYRVLVRPFLLSSEHASALGEWVHPLPFAAFLFFAGLIAIVHVVLSALLAYPLTVRSLPGRGICKALLILFLAAGPMVVQHFLYWRPLLNTPAPYVLFGMFSPAAVFVLKERFNQLYGGRKREAERTGRGEDHALMARFLANMRRPLVGLGVLQAIALWNSFLIPLIYQSAGAWQSPIMVFFNMSFGAGGGGIPFGDPVVLRAGALVSLPPVLLFLLLRRFVVADLFVAQSRGQ